MLILLPIICFVLFALVLAVREERGWREAAVKSAMGCFIFVLLSTEVLSAFNALTTGSVALAWTLFLVIMAAVLSRLRDRLPQIFRTFTVRRTGWETFVLSVLGVILGITAFNALIAPPNNWDSMTYHLPRVMHWIQNRSVAYYATNDLRQLSYPPLAEYAILHLQLLCGSDRFANMVQWFSFLLCLIIASLIAKRLGAGSRGQWLAALLGATLPMNILQATSTQNNLVLAFFVTAFAFFCLDRSQEKTDPSASLWMAAGLGCAMLTKGLALMACSPFLIIPLFSKRPEGRDILRRVGMFVLVLILLLGPTAGRNMRFYHRPFPTDAETSNLLTRDNSLRVFLSSLLRNAALHWATPSSRINHGLETLVAKEHVLLGVDLSDPRYSFAGHVFRYAGLNRHEDHAGNLLHFFLFLLAAVLWLTHPEQRRQQTMILYCAAVLAGVLIFCGTLKWQPWHSRLHVPFFLLYAPFAASVFDRIKNKVLVPAVGLLCSVLATPWIFANQSRPLFSDNGISRQERDRQYFANNPGMYYSYRKTADDLAAMNCVKVGLSFSGDSWEYPLWPLLKKSEPDAVIRHVNVSNNSAVLADKNFEPCAVISDKTETGGELRVGNRIFVRTLRSAFLSTYLPDPTGRLSRRLLLLHLKRTLELTGQVNRLMSSLPPGQTMTGEQMSALVTLRRLQLRESELLNPEDLDAILPGFGNQFRHFQKGLRMVTEGFGQKNRWAYQEGQKELRRWELWFQSNIDSIKQAFGE